MTNDIPMILNLKKIHSITNRKSKQDFFKVSIKRRFLSLYKSHTMFYSATMWYSLEINKYYLISLKLFKCKQQVKYGVQQQLYSTNKFYVHHMIF